MTSRAAADHDLVDVAAHQHLAVAIGGRHRVVVAVAHECQRGDPRGRWSQASKAAAGRAARRGKSRSAARRCVCVMTAHPGQPLDRQHCLEMRVELREAGDTRDRHQEVASRIADQPLDLALVVALAGPAEAVEEQVVRLQLGEGARPLSRAITQDAGHCQLGVVVENRVGTPPRKAKAALWPSRKASVVSAG